MANLYRDRHNSSDDAHHADAMKKADRLLAAFSHASVIGFAIFDNDLRYRCINQTLAALNGVPADAHLDRTLEDILGEASLSVGPALKFALEAGKVVSTQMAGAVPGRNGCVHWIASYFPVHNRRTRLKHTGALVVDVTDLKELEISFVQSSQQLLRNQNRVDNWLATELRGSIEQYFAALSESLVRMTRHAWQLDMGADDQLSPAIELLDQRVHAMRNLAVAVAARRESDRLRQS